jgi:tRNA (guanine9-N1)-methyltransferase
MKMADIEERPSKIRKVDLLDHDENLQESPLEPLDMSDKGKQNGTRADGDDSNDSPNGEIQGTAEGGAVMSKNQLKRLRKQEKWLAGKEYRKTKRREKHKERQARKAAAAEEAAKSGVEVPAISPDKLHPKRPILVPVTLIIDCDFNDLMTDKELISLGSQLTRSYSDNKANQYRSHMVMSSWGGKLQTRFETVLANHHLNWKGVRFLGSDFEAAARELDAVMRSPEGGKLVGALSEGEGQDSDDKTDVVPAEEAELKEESITEPEKQAELEFKTTSLEQESNPASAQNTDTETSQAAPAPSIVYLTSDSPHTLDRLYPNTSYIIGGIVDKNRHKGICYKRACERGIPTAKLPIGEFMTMQSRSVLAVNHVVQIMLEWLKTGDWGEAFLNVIPKRKEAKLKFGNDGSANGGEVEGEGEDAESAKDGEDGDDVVDREPEGVSDQTAVPTE